MMCFSAFFPCIYMPKATHDFPFLSNWGFSSYHIHTVVIHFLENLTSQTLSSSFCCSSALNIVKNILHEEEMCQTGSQYLLRVCYWLMSLPNGQWMKCRKYTPKREILILSKEGFSYQDSYTKTELKRCSSEKSHLFPVLMIKVQSLVPV